MMAHILRNKMYNDDDEGDEDYDVHYNDDSDDVGSE